MPPVRSPGCFVGDGTVEHYKALSFLMASATQVTQQPSDSEPLDKYLSCESYNLTLKLVYF